MRLRFGPEEDAAYRSAKRTLLDGFEQWLLAFDGVGPEHARLLVDDVKVAFDWKWADDDGDLAYWNEGHLAAFLLGWCPGHFAGPTGDLAGLPHSLAALVAFLDQIGLLDPRSEPVERLQSICASYADDFEEAMAAPSRKSTGSRLLGLAVDDGVDLSDQAAVQEWMAGWNALPVDERRRLLPLPEDHPAGAAELLLPPMARPPDDERRAAEAAAPILAMFAALAAHYGAAGRKLTAKGHPTMADARVLVPLLGTGDRIDEQIGDRVFKTRTAADLHILRLVITWARKAGVIKIVHNKLSATKAGLALAADPARHFDRTFDALFAAGPLRAQMPETTYRFWSIVDQFLEESVPHLLADVYAANQPVLLDTLIETAGNNVLASFGGFGRDDDDVRMSVGYDVDRIVDALELAGVLRRLPAPPGLRLVGEAGGGPARGGDHYWIPLAERIAGVRVELTTAGIEPVRRLLAAAGYETPEARFADATAAGLLTGTAQSSFPEVMGEFGSWCRRRSAEEAVAELADAAAGSDDPALQNMALALMSDLGPDVAAPHVRRLAAMPGTGGFARCWLVDLGLEPPASLYDPDDLATFVNVLASRAVTRPPEELLGTLALAGGPDAQIALLARLWRCPSPATATVLESVGLMHPDKPVAKAARKALFQHRSLVPVR